MSQTTEPSAHEAYEFIKSMEIAANFWNELHVEKRKFTSAGLENIAKTDASKILVIRIWSQLENEPNLFGYVASIDKKLRTRGEILTTELRELLGTLLDRLQVNMDDIRCLHASPIESTAILLKTLLDTYVQNGGASWDTPAGQPLPSRMQNIVEKANELGLGLIQIPTNAHGASERAVWSALEKQIKRRIKMKFGFGGELKMRKEKVEKTEDTKKKVTSQVKQTQYIYKPKATVGYSKRPRRTVFQEKAENLEKNDSPQPQTSELGEKRTECTNNEGTGIIENIETAITSEISEENDQKFYFGVDPAESVNTSVTFEPYARILNTEAEESRANFNGNDDFLDDRSEEPKDVAATQIDEVKYDEQKLTSNDDIETTSSDDFKQVPLPSPFSAEEYVLLPCDVHFNNLNPSFDFGKIGSERPTVGNIFNAKITEPSEIQADISTEPNVGHERISSQLVLPVIDEDNDTQETDSTKEEDNLEDKILIEKNANVLDQEIGDNEILFESDVEPQESTDGFAYSTNEQGETELFCTRPNKENNQQVTSDASENIKNFQTLMSRSSETSANQINYSDCEEASQRSPLWKRNDRLTLTALACAFGLGTLSYLAANSSSNVLTEIVAQIGHKALSSIERALQVLRELR